jgi:adenine-specific DNA-methyltransferase
MDFFAGSGATGHAVLKQNNEDGGQRRFVLVQLPEPLPKPEAALKTIASICKERVRRVINKLNEEDAGKLDLDGAKQQDRGFRVFKLAESNFTPWNAEVPHDAAALAQQLELHVDHIRAGRTAQDLLYEILLKSGFPLTTPVEPLQLAGKTVYSVAVGALFLCLGGCPRIMDDQHLISQNAPESTIGDLGGVLATPPTPIFVFLGQAPSGVTAAWEYNVA